MIAGPKVARVVTEFEENVQPSIDNVNADHHDQKKSNQKSFMKDVSSLINTMQEMGNPFSEDSQDLIALDSKQIMPEEVIDFVKGAKMIGEDQYELFVTERLQRGNVAITDTIKHNKFALFGTPTEKKRSNKEQKMVALKNDCPLFSRLYIACQAREGNLEEFFRHENQPFPPSLSVSGKLRHGKKSELIDCLQTASQHTEPVVDLKAIDGAAAVHIFTPTTACKTFQDYADKVFFAVR